jgi:hypothetical protein
MLYDLALGSNDLAHLFDEPWIKTGQLIDLFGRHAEPERIGQVP